MEQYGLIGLKLGHSFSLNYFNEKFKNENIDAVYVNYEISNIEDIFEIIASNPDLKGLNVTIPYKEQIIPYLDEVTPEATTIGAVNVVKITHQGSKTILKGFNSDVVGFTQSIEPLLERIHKKALILGTGGSAKAIAFGLKSLGLEVLFVSRTPQINAITYSEVTEDIIKEYKVIVNCTPLGMYPNSDSFPELPYEAMDSSHLLYDLIYNPNETTFMKKGASQGATVKNGLEMLLLQAFVSWKYWHGK